MNLPPLSKTSGHFMHVPNINNSADLMNSVTGVPLFSVIIVPGCLMWVLERNCMIGTHTLKCEIDSVLVLFIKAFFVATLVLILLVQDLEDCMFITVHLNRTVTTLHVTQP